MSRDDHFARISCRYDRVNKVLSLGRDGSWREAVLQRLPAGRTLDLGAGTGALTRAHPEREVVALDPSLPMLGLNPGPLRVAGVGERLPFADNAFDAVFAAYVMRNLSSVEEALAEVARVLRPGGAMGIVGLGRPRGALARLVHRAGTSVVLPTVGLLAGAPGEYRYLHRSLDRLPHPEELYAAAPLEVEEVWRMGVLGFVHGVVLGKET